MITKRSPSCTLYFLMQVVVCVTLAPFAVTQTPAGYWPFTDGTGTKATDASGNGHAATLVHGVSWVGGQLGSGVSAKAANRQYVSIPPIDLSTTKAITVALWVNRAFSMTGGRTLFEATSDFTQSITGFGFFPDDTTCNGIQAAINGDIGETANCYAQPSSEVWHHIAIVYDKTQTGGDQVAFYVDGVFQNPTRSLFASNNSNYFGNNPIYLFSRGGMTMFDSGAIDDFRIYNSALSPAQISKISHPSKTLQVNSGSTSSFGRGMTTTSVSGNGGGVRLTVTAQVALSWTASTTPAIVGYNAYRSMISGGPYTKLNSSLITITSYTDLAVNSGYTYYYVTSAVDSQGNESVYSNQNAATVP